MHKDKEAKIFIDNAIQEAFSDFSIKDEEMKNTITIWVLDDLENGFKQEGKIPAYALKSFIWYLVKAYHIILEARNKLEQKEEDNGQKIQRNPKV